MRRGRVTAGTLALAAAAAIGAASLEDTEPPVPQSPVPPARLTIVQDDAELLFHPERSAASMRELRALGVDWVRLTAGWSKIAPAPRSTRRPDFDATDPASYPRGAWARLDLAVLRARDAGLRPMIDIAFWAPRWAVTREPDRPDRPRWELDPEAFGEFARAVARRYSGSYGDLPAAVAFTIWNEPNYGVFLLPQRVRDGDGWRVASAHRYRRMVYAAHPAIKEAAPRALVLIGGTSPAGSRRPRTAEVGVPPLEFLRELACVDAAGAPLKRDGCDSFRPLPGDGWAHHPYSTRRPPEEGDPSPDNVRVADLGRLSRSLERLHAAGRTEKDLDVWVTEYGYETDPPDPTQPWSPAQQARFLAEGERLAYTHPRVRSFAQFLLRDLGPVVPASDQRTRWRDFQSGLHFVDGRPKLALEAFRTPLIAEPGGEGVRFWGRVRPGTGSRPFRLSALGEDGWRPVPGLPATLRTDREGFFSVTAPGPLARRYRVERRLADAWRAAPAVGVSR